MWILFSLLLVFAASSLLLIKIKAAANNSGPVWQTVAPENSPESEPAAELVVAMDNSEPRQIVNEMVAEPERAAELEVAMDKPYSQQIMTEIVLPLDRPARAAKPKARRARALAAGRS